MNNFIYDHYKGVITKIDCGDMDPEYAAKILNLTHVPNKDDYPFKLFAKPQYGLLLYCDKFTDYLPITLFYCAGDIMYPNHRMFYVLSNVDPNDLINYYKNSYNFKVNGYVDDFSQNWKKYVEESYIKNIIE